MANAAVNADPREAEHPSLTLTRRLRARPEKVYAAWTQAAQLVQWFGPPNMTRATLDAELDVRTAAPGLAADLTRHVADLLDRAHAAGAVRKDLTVEDLMALVAGAFAAIRHAGAETSRERSAHIARIILDGLRPRPGYR